VGWQLDPRHRAACNAHSPPSFDSLTLDLAAVTDLFVDPSGKYGTVSLLLPIFNSAESVSPTYSS
jgi:hypothetical protein